MKKADKIDALGKLKVFVESKDFGIGGWYDGLCLVITNGIKIKKEQRKYLESIIPPHLTYNYVWRRGSKAPRIKWINEQIKKLEKK